MSYTRTLMWEKDWIPYRPWIAKIIWVIPAILLQQITYRSWNWKFYKFTEPSKHELYREWDSWCEELWMKVDMFTDNLKKIGYKLWKTKNIIKKEDALVIYYTDSNRVTRYELQEHNSDKLLSIVYSTDSLVNGKSPDTKENGNYPDTIPTENTTENTTYNKKDNMSKNSSTHTQSVIADENKKTMFTNKWERFDEFWKTFPHPRTAKKKDALDFYRRSDYTEDEILFESKLLELKIKYWLQDIKYVKGCALWTRDLVKTPSVILEKIIKEIVYAHMKNPKKIREDVELLISVFWQEKIMQYNKEYNKEFNSITFNLT